jgi:hypothetical protein
MYVAQRFGQEPIKIALPTFNEGCEEWERQNNQKK